MVAVLSDDSTVSRRAKRFRANPPTRETGDPMAGSRATCLGVGLGYRPELHALATGSGLVDWIEIISEHYMEDRAAVERLRQQFPGVPIVPHGIEMSIGTLGNDREWLRYISALRELVSALDAPWFSDHLCFTHSGGENLAMLAPLPRTGEMAAHVGRRAREAQETVGKPFLLENVAYHLSWGDELSEAEFVSRVISESGCYLLLDLTNLLYNGKNHGYDPVEFLGSLPLDRVLQVHLAGGVESDGVLYDSHSHSVPPQVWDLLAQVLTVSPLRGVMLERDSRLDRQDEICADLERIRAALAGTQGVIRDAAGQCAAVTDPAARGADAC